jgi:uncharacterized protein (TIGR03067 family)
VVEATIDPGRAREEAARRDRDRLQGVWRFVSGKRKARLLISGDHFTMHFESGDVYVGTFTLDAMARPKAMDLHIREGPEAFRGKTALAIYELDADYLIWCPAEPGREERLTAFPPMDALGPLCIIFQREKGAGCGPS